jgi:hypothetical protein
MGEQYGMTTYMPSGEIQLMSDDRFAVRARRDKGNLEMNSQLD